jgi:hypothetical protein
MADSFDIVFRHWPDELRAEDRVFRASRRSSLQYGDIAVGGHVSMRGNRRRSTELLFPSIRLTRNLEGSFLLVHGKDRLRIHKLSPSQWEMILFPKMLAHI